MKNERLSLQVVADLQTMSGIVMSMDCVKSGMNLITGVQAMAQHIYKLEAENKILNQMLNK